MATVNDIVSFLLNDYPLSQASHFDEGKVGLQFGSNQKTIKKVMIALDGTTKVINDAITQNVDLLILHHPFMFAPMLSLDYDNPLQTRYKEVIKNELNVFAMHTNFDVATDGMNEILLGILGVSDINKEEDVVSKNTFIRFGNIEPMTLAELIKIVKSKFNLEVVRFIGDEASQVTKIGIVGGAGGSDLYTAKTLGCDTFISGEIRHNQALDAIDLGINIIEVPHAVEGLFKEFIKNKLQSNFPDVEFITSKLDIDPFKIG